MDLVLDAKTVESDLPVLHTEDVSFRDLLPGLPHSDFTHSIYPYPARLLRGIPRYMLGQDTLTKGIDFVVDPFCGSGTVLLEALLAGHAAVGMDSSPVAALISRVKTDLSFGQEHLAAADELQRSSRRSRRRKVLPEFVERWLDPTTASIVGRLMANLDLVAPGAPRDFAAMGVAMLVRRHAQMDSRISVPVRAKSPVRSATWESMARIFQELEAKCRTLADSALTRSSIPMVLNMDSREKTAWNHSSISGNGLLFTSPPYGTAQKYVRAMSLEAGVLGYAGASGTRSLDLPTIGRERLSADEAFREARRLKGTKDRLLSRIQESNQSRAFAYSAYLEGLRAVFDRASEASIQQAVIVSGDNIVAGHAFPTRRYIARMMMDNGFDHQWGWRDRIAGRTLLTKRKGGSPAAEFEYVDVFQRGERIG